MPKIVRFHETGSADVLKLEDLLTTEPGEGQVRLKVEAIGARKEQGYGICPFPSTTVATEEFP